VPRPTGLDIRVLPQGARVVVSPEGEVDLSNTAALRSALWSIARDGCTCIELDLRGLEFIDTSGLHLVIDLVRHCQDESIELAVRPGPYAIQRAFEISGLGRAVPFTDGVTTPAASG
jgi:anti-anti-sigma factor